MEVSSAPWSAARAWRVLIYRLIANSFWPLFAIGIVTIVLRWTLPQLLPALIYVWLVVAGLLTVIAIPWLAVSIAFSSGTIKCPSCSAPFAPGFILWVPRKCRNCGYDVMLRMGDATSNNRWRGP